MSRSSVSLFLSGVLGLLLLQCRVDERVAYEIPNGPPELITPSTVPDAGAAGYCPSNKCPEDYTSCPSSRFSCDVNLKTDPNNCGACGVECPKVKRPPGGVFTDPHEFAMSWSCLDGRCALLCNPEAALDCDGLVDNGCETLPSENDNCGACGNVCSDPAKPCIQQPGGGYGCGCPAGFGACLFGICESLESNDANCGACLNRCNPNGDGGVLAPNTYYGCAGSTCGNLKCTSGMGNCDANAANGCETPLNTNEHCGACDNTCPDGQSCLYDKDIRGLRCACPPGLTYCDQRCVDLSSDDSNCGTCGNICGTPGAKVHVGLCAYGTCTFTCSAGWADCNGNPADGCEINTMSDPQNCGGCGITCNGIAGQACAGGRCVVEPCNQDGGVVAR